MCDAEGTEYADFNTCVYPDGSDLEPKFKKPQRFVDKLLKGLGRLTAKCGCPPSFAHPKMVGTEASAAGLLREVRGVGLSGVAGPG